MLSKKAKDTAKTQRCKKVIIELQIFATWRLSGDRINRPFETASFAMAY
jgi:hypothetical protein